MHGQMPVGQIAPLKKFLSESYPGSTLSDLGPVAKTAKDLLASNVATKFAAKSGRTKHLEGKPGHTLCGEEAHKDTLVDSVTDSTCHYCVQAWEKKHG